MQQFNLQEAKKILLEMSRGTSIGFGADNPVKKEWPIGMSPEKIKGIEFALPYKSEAAVKTADGLLWALKALTGKNMRCLEDQMSTPEFAYKKIAVGIDDITNPTRVTIALSHDFIDMLKRHPARSCLPEKMRRGLV